MCVSVCENIWVPPSQQTCTTTIKQSHLQPYSSCVWKVVSFCQSLCFPHIQASLNYFLTLWFYGFDSVLFCFVFKRPHMCGVCVCLCVLATRSCPILCYPVDYSPPGSSVHGILQTRILEWVAIMLSKLSQRKTCAWCMWYTLYGMFFCLTYFHLA